MKNPDNPWHCGIVAGESKAIPVPSKNFFEEEADNDSNDKDSVILKSAKMSKMPKVQLFATLIQKKKTRS